MTREISGTSLEDALLSLDELATSCNVSREWVIEHVECGVLLENAGSDPKLWVFGSQSLIRARRILSVEKYFDSNPELAGLVADLVEEIEYLRTKTSPRK